MTVKKEKKAKTNIRETTFNETYDEQFCFVQFRIIPTPVSKIQKLSEELIAWAKKTPDAYSIRKFFNNHDIARSDYYRWVDKYDFMRVAHEQALSLIADRREDGAIKHNPASAMPYMPLYDIEYKKYAEWRASLTRKDEDKKQDIHVHIEPMPSSDLVPEKKKEEKKDAKFWD